MPTEADIPVDAFCLIIGAMKCGTTSLYDYLTEDPGICPCVAKEPMFWSDPANQQSSKALENYRKLFAFEPDRHLYAIEASTNYSKYPSFPGVPEAMARSGLLPKIIYVVRNPFDRIESHFNYALHTSFRSPSIVDSHLVELSNYHLQLERFATHLPQADILLVNFAQLVANPIEPLGRISDFLGVTGFEQSQSLPRSNTTNLPTKVEAAYRDSLVSRVGRYLPGNLRSVTKRILRRVSPPPKRASLSPAERAHVHGLLERDMWAFSEKYDFDVKQWGF